MSDDQKALHVNPLGGDWEVESESTTLGQANTKAEAVDLAKELAAEEGASRVTVHTSDGHTVEQIHLGAGQKREEVNGVRP